MRFALYFDWVRGDGDMPLPGRPQGFVKIPRIFLTPTIHEPGKPSRPRIVGAGLAPALAFLKKGLVCDND